MTVTVGSLDLLFQSPLDLAGELGRRLSGCGDVLDERHGYSPVGPDRKTGFAQFRRSVDEHAQCIARPYDIGGILGRGIHVRRRRGAWAAASGREQPQEQAHESGGETPAADHGYPDVIHV